MTIEAVNEFCKLFAELKEVIDVGEKETPRHHHIVIKMRNLWSKMDWREQKKTLQWNELLTQWGFYDEEIGKVDLEGCEEESGVSGEFEHATYIVSPESGQPAFQYNEHSVPLHKMSPEDKDRIQNQMWRQWAVQEELMKIDPHERNKLLQKRWGSGRVQRKWSLPDEERDW